VTTLYKANRVISVLLPHIISMLPCHATSLPDEIILFVASCPMSKIVVSRLLVLFVIDTIGSIVYIFCYLFYDRWSFRVVLLFPDALHCFLPLPLSSFFNTERSQSMASAVRRCKGPYTLAGSVYWPYQYDSVSYRPQNDIISAAHSVMMLCGWEVLKF